MSKTACASCSTSAAEDVALPIALGLALLLYDPGVQTAVPKATAVGGIALALLAFGIAAMWRGERRLLTLPLLLWVMGCGWLVASLAWSDEGQPLAALPLVSAAALGLAFVGLPRATLEVVAGRAAMLVSFGSSVSAMWMRARGAVPHGLHGNPDWLGLVLVAAAPFILMRASKARGIERHLAIAAGALALAGLVLSQSRSAWIGAAVAAVTLARGRRRSVAALGGALLVLLLLVVTDLSVAWTGRTWIWKSAWRAAVEAPLLGVGAGRFGFAFLDAQGAALSSLPLDTGAVRFVNATSAHNDALHLWVEAGAPCVLLLVGALMVAAWQLGSRWRLASASILAVLVAGLGDVALRQPGVLVFVAVGLAGSPRLRARRHDAIASGLALVAVGLLLPLGLSQWIAERRVEGSKGLNPFERVEQLELAAEIASDPGPASFELGITLLSFGESERAEAMLLRSRKTFANVGTDVAIASARLSLEDAPGAVRALQQALRKQPARFAAHANLVEAARQAGDLDLAERHLAAAKELQPNHPKLRAIEEKLRRTVIDSRSSE